MRSELAFHRKMIFSLHHNDSIVEALQDIFNDTALKILNVERVPGGDINDAYCLVTTNEKYFLKVNDADKFPAMFEKEARGLELLRKNSSIIIPQVIKTGSTGGKQYLLLEWLEKGVPKKDSWQKFGEALAMMHKQPQDFFGLDEYNYIGSLMQVNGEFSDWPSFYAERRILPLVKILFDEGVFSMKDADIAQVLCKKLHTIFPTELPSLIHGDLWAGNYLIHSSGYAAFYDPAVYFGHREMDIGMTRLFGGFDQSFYNAYNTTYRLEKDWEQRILLVQLYPVLVHAVLFGGHYRSQSMDIIKRFS